MYVSEWVFSGWDEVKVFIFDFVDNVFEVIEGGCIFFNEMFNYVWGDYWSKFFLMSLFRVKCIKVRLRIMSLLRR